MQLSQLNIEPHNSCYTCWVQVVYSHLLLHSSVLLGISSTASQYQATWRTISADLMISRRLSPSRRPCGALFFMYFFLRFRTPWTDSWFSCNKDIHLQFVRLLFRDMCCDILMILLYICVTWSWRIYDCSICAFINRVWQNWYQSQVDCRTKPS
jgi:hypothetical protein